MKFETIVIIKPTLSEENKNQVVQDIVDFINNNDGDVFKKEIWGDRKLAYPIQKFNDGFYALLEFSCDKNGETVDKLNFKYNNTEDIIKHIIVKMD